MHIYTVTNQKGGCGKTTTAVALASILTSLGYKTLFIDTDAQCNSTRTFGAKIDGVATLYDLILDDDPCTIEEAIQHTQYCDVIASDPQLIKADEMLANTAGAFFRLRDALASLKGYDYVVMDTNPSTKTTLYNALVAADSVVAPILPDEYSLEGLQQVLDLIVGLKQYNPGLVFEGVLLVRFRSYITVDRIVRDGLVKSAGAAGIRLFDTCIREDVKTKEAQVAHMPLLYYSKSCNAEKDYEAFVQELLGRR